MLVNHLPTATTSFVGRAEELSSIAALLADPQCRLLTLLGPGGIGKTRLALQAAAEQAAYFAHGVYFVSLTSVTSPGLIASAIAGALQISFYDADEIIRYLREKQLLLVLDNFEHLLEGSDLLVDLLQACPAVKLLVTSRERLNLQEEWLLALDGLRVPQNDHADSLESYTAVQLFVQRARQMQATFSLSENAEAVRTICQRVEGMPLGLELAASWLRVMSCTQVAARIAESLDFLTTPLRNVPERHRSLRAVFEQSWKLLSPDEQDALMRLSVFRGGFDLESAEQVTGACLPVLADLADKSLIRLNANGRYDLHELLRQYAADKLGEAGETRAAADQHLCYFLKLAEQAEAHVWGRDQQAWYDRLEVDMDNLRVALNRSLEGGDAVKGLRLAGALGWLFTERSRPNEGLNWLERLLAANQDAPASLRAKALNHAGELAGLSFQRQRTQVLCKQALELAHSVDDRQNMAWAQSNLGYYSFLKNHPGASEVALLESSITQFRELQDVMGLNHALRRLAQIVIEQGNYPYARRLLEEALVSARESDDRNAIAQALLTIGDIFWLQDSDLAQAAQQYEGGLALFREMRNRLGMIYAGSNLGRIEQVKGNYAQALAYYREALMLVRDFAPDSNPCDHIVAGVASVVATRGNLTRAATLFGSVEHILMNHSANEHPMQVIFRRNLASVRAQMGEDAFAEAWATGKAMTKAQTIDCALQDDDFSPESVTVLSSANGQALRDLLTERELEILRAVAEGHSNRQIAAELFLALGTVKWYLNTINSKLGVASRTQAVARAREIGLFS